MTGITDYAKLAGFRPDLYDKLMDIIHIVTDPKMRKMFKEQGLVLDWDEIARVMKDGAHELPTFIKPQTPDMPTETPFQHIDRALGIDKVAPVLRDAPKLLAVVREELNGLIRKQTTTDDFTRLLGIVEQVVMHLENLPKWSWTIPSVAPFPAGPIYPPAIPSGGTPQTWPPYTPYVGDPPFPDSSTICSATSEVPRETPFNHTMGTGVTKDEFPF